MTLRVNLYHVVGHLRFYYPSNDSYPLYMTGNIILKHKIYSMLFILCPLQDKIRDKWSDCTAIRDLGQIHNSFWNKGFCWWIVASEREHTCLILSKRHAIPLATRLVVIYWIVYRIDHIRQVTMHYKREKICTKCIIKHNIYLSSVIDIQVFRLI